MGDSGSNADYDVVILGAGIAGLTLARQLLMYSDKKVLLLEKRAQIPPPRQKVGESNVQVQGYYLSKILDMEEHLLREHFLKYNLRFYWPTPGQPNTGYEHYSQSYIRFLSNICCYQLDRNKIEGELLRVNLQNPRFSFEAGVSNLDISLASGSAPHVVAFEVDESKNEVQTTWVVDTTGRSKFLARRLALTKANPIRHGSVFFWVDGLLNIEKLTDLSHREMLLHPNRRKLGHIPAWLATNHFCGEGYWFWVIPLQGKTSLGLVYDRAKVNEDEVSSPEKVIEWVCKRHPLFARDLPKQKIIDQAMHRDFSYDCKQTISADRWALAGEAGRFTDPLYSPGGDLISLYNTFITDAILTDDEQTLAVKARLYELLMWGLYEAYVPSYAVSYEVLGDQECFVMKYCWELTIYFTFYVFPFINQVFTDTSFVVPYLDVFAQLGPLNNSVQAFITAYYRWKQTRPVTAREPNLFDFTGLEPLKKSEELFYKIGFSSRECIRLLRQSMPNIENLARFIAVYIYSVVLENDNLITNKQLIESVSITNLNFDPEAMSRECRSLDPARDVRMEKLGAEFIKHFRKAVDRTRKVTKPMPTAIPIAAGAKFA
jgi:2-polyprenyl-6-methoxyphenol hydroxylase-like FAD-dependent oxidoreductase